MDQLVSDSVDDRHFVLSFCCFPLKKTVHDIAFPYRYQCGQVKHFFDVLVGQMRYPGFAFDARSRAVFKRRHAGKTGKGARVGQARKPARHFYQFRCDDRSRI